MNPITTFQSDFNGLAVDIIDHAGKRWLTAEQVGRCLGYNEANARTGITNLYNRHVEEFTEADTCAIKLMAQGQRREVRVFSTSGCVTLSWLSGTSRAKKFKQWAKTNLAAQIEGDKVALNFDEVSSLVDAAKPGEAGREARQRALEIFSRFRQGHEIAPAVAVPAAQPDRLEVAMEKMASHVGTLAVGMETVLAQLNVTARYIGLLEQNQRGTVKVTPEIVQQVQEMLAAGTPQNDICRLLRISRGTVWRIKGGERINRQVSGSTEAEAGLAEALQEMADSCRAALPPLRGSTEP